MDPHLPWNHFHNVPRFLNNNGHVIQNTEEMLKCCQFFSDQHISPQYTFPIVQNQLNSPQSSSFITCNQFTPTNLSTQFRWTSPWWSSNSICNNDSVMDSSEHSHSSMLSQSDASDKSKYPYPVVQNQLNSPHSSSLVRCSQFTPLNPISTQYRWVSPQWSPFSVSSSNNRRTVGESEYSHSQGQESNKSMTEWDSSPRRWRLYDGKRKKNWRSMNISVMSYNVLSQSLLEEHPYLYSDCEDEALDWSVRGPALMKQFKHHKSDILCLQEVQDNHWETFFQPNLKSLGYEGYFVKRTGSKPDGCAILFKPTKFKLIEFVPVKFQRSGILNRDNVGAILLLKPKKTYYRGKASKICVATTHLLFNPKRGDIKLAQLMLFLAEIEKYSFLTPTFETSQMPSTSSQPCGTDSNNQTKTRCHSYCPVILCGDMNLEPRSSLYDFIVEGYIGYDKCCSLDLSGQREGKGRSNSYLSAKLLPKSLGINNHCQFIQHALNRTSQSMPCANETSDSKFGESSENKDSEINNVTHSDENDKTSLMNTGQAFHNFNFKSVYPHHSRLVTTHHGRASCMVDYIFYSSRDISLKSEFHRTKSDKKKRKRCESTNSEMQYSSISNPSKTVKSECEIDIGKNEHVNNIRRNENVNQMTNVNNTTRDSCQYVYSVQTSGAHSLEPAEVWSSDDQECSTSNDKEKTLSDSVVPERGLTCDIDQNKNMQKQISEESLELLGYWSLLSLDEFKEQGCLPNNIFPSDHICLIAKFLLH